MMTGVLDCQRDQFAFRADTHYLNCAYLAPLAQSVERAGARALLEQCDPTTVSSEEFYFTRVDRVRRLYAQLIGTADWERVALVPSVSYGLGIVTANTRIGAGQNVVVIGDEFPSGVLPWHRQACERRAEVRTVSRPVRVRASEQTSQWSERIASAIDAETAAVMVVPAHWCDGTRFDMGMIAERARAVGAAVVVDGTQSVGALPFDFGHVRPDAVLCAGYKWLLGAYGMALAYLGERYDEGTPLEENWTSQIGSDDLATLSDYAHEYRLQRGRYDGGERASPVLVSMLEASLQQLIRWGPGRIQAYCEAIAAPLWERAEAMGLVIDTSEGRCSHLFGVRFADRRNVRAVARLLAANDVHVSIRGEAIRVAPHVYNDARDIEALIDALAATRDMP